MSEIKLNIILFLLTIGSTKQGILKIYFMQIVFFSFFSLIVNGQCMSPFSSGDAANFCYDYDGTSSSWLDGYNRCLDESMNGILMEIFTVEEFNALKNLNMDINGSFWLGAYNFASGM